MPYLRLTLCLLVILCLVGRTTPAPAQDCLPYTGQLINEQRMGENLCAITFDDGPSAFTPQLLDMLDGYGIPATFFMLGLSIRQHPDIVRRVAAEGHEVANHSYSHPNLKTRSSRAKREQLASTSELIRSLTGEAPRLLRPPYGAKDEDVVRVAAELGMRVVTWSYDSLDWKRLPGNHAQMPNAMGFIPTRGHLRGIFLFHDIHKTTVDDLPRIVAQLKEGGCQRFVTVSDYMDGLYLDPEPPMLMTRRRHAVAPSRAPAAGQAQVADLSLPLETGARQVAGEPGRERLQPAVYQVTEAAEGSPEPFVGVAANTAWQGFARDSIAILPPRKVRYRPSLTAWGEGRHGLLAPSPSFPKGQTVVQPPKESSAYILRPLGAPR